MIRFVVGYISITVAMLSSLSAAEMASAVEAVKFLRDKATMNYISYTYVDGDLYSASDWVSRNVVIPASLPLDSLSHQVVANLIVDEQGHARCEPIGYNNPLLMESVRAAVALAPKWSTPQKWSVLERKIDFDRSYHAIRFTVDFCYLPPAIEPDYLHASLPKRIKRRELPYTYRGDYLYPVFERAESERASINEFREYVMTNLYYPLELMKSKVIGEVIVRFYLDREGAVDHVEVLKSPHELISEEVVRVIKSSPRWSPVMRWNYLTKSYDKQPTSFTIPVQFYI